MSYIDSQSFAQSEDQQDQLARFKEYFHVPKKNKKDVIYFCGNSLGLQPITAGEFINKELKKWRELGVEGHFHGENPWFSFHETSKESLSKLVGASAHEVVSMNNLTTNLHLMLASFYQPKGKRVKILIESGAFPSDHYAVESHMAMKGVDPAQHLICLKPKEGVLFTEDEILGAIASIGDELALVMLPGIQYYTGQFLPLKSITAKAHEVGAFCGFDLAHSMGNIPVSLHDNQVDFAVWCSYKYLNSGPGGVSGAFVHEKHGLDATFPRLTGWWGHDPESRFRMDNQFVPAKGVDSWMLSNVNIISMAAHLASLKIFDEAGIHELRKKSIRLTGFLEFLLKLEPLSSDLTILTPANPGERGCQLSISLTRGGKEVFHKLIERGVILDWREPNVIRVAPTPLYNSFEEVWEFCQILKEILRSHD